MRICHVIGTDEVFGGLERHVVDLASLQSAAHEVMVAAAPHVLERLPATIRGVRMPMHLNRRDPRLIWALRRALREFRPEVVHAQAGKAALLVKLASLFLPRMARVATVHGTKRSPGAFRGFDQVIAVSRRAGDQLKSIPHTIVWNGIAPVSPDPVTDAGDLPFTNRGGRPLIIAVGRLVPVKGFDLLIDALRSVDACLWLVGDGPLRAKLESQASRKGVRDRVWFAGFRQDAGRLMALADLMVISSRAEGFPLVMIEMLLRRRPVVATRVGATDDVLPQEWICEPGDAEALAHLMRRALSRMPRLADDFAPVYEQVGRELTLEANCLKIDAVYQSALRSLLGQGGRPN